MMNRAAAVARSRWAAPLVLALGVLPRAAHYLSDRSLWNDETALALNIIGLSFGELRGGLGGEQVAPFGFLVAEKGVVGILGAGELALRLIPFLASLAALWLFWRILRRELERPVALWALALFAANESLIYYAGELKQYSTDVLAALVIVDAAGRLREPGAHGPRLVWAAGVGAAALWISHTALFVCAGAALAWAWAPPAGGPGRRGLAGVGAAWLASFVLEYWLVLRFTPGIAGLSAHWKHTFMPIVPASLEALAWYPRTFGGVFRDPLFLGLPLLGALLFLVGCASAWQRQRLGLWLWAAPIGVALLFSALKLYPFGTLGQLPHVTRPEMFHPPHGRFILFSVPAWIALMAWGVQGLASRRAAALRVAAALLALALLLQPLVAAARLVWQPPQVHDVRSLVDDLRRDYREGDTLVVIPFPLPLEYYLTRVGWDLPIAMRQLRKPEDIEAWSAELDASPPGARIWVVSVEHPRWTSAALGELARRVLRERAEPVQESRHFRASASLFRMR